jgi:hypothetical protein
MSDYAIDREAELLTQGYDYDIILKMVKEEVQKGYPSYFVNKNQNTPPAVSPSPGTVTSTRKKHSFNDLPEEHKMIVRQYKNLMGDKFDMDRYINILKENGTLN